MSPSVVSVVESVVVDPPTVIGVMLNESSGFSFGHLPS